MHCSESTLILINTTFMDIRNYNPGLAADEWITENGLFVITTRLCVPKSNQWLKYKDNQSALNIIFF
jgi:hypothetical protein